MKISKILNLDIDFQDFTKAKKCWFSAVENWECKQIGLQILGHNLPE